nr:nucleoside triphosphate pyrophosphohydrolase [Bacillus cereus]
MPTHNKLIRNKIPQIIKANGKTPTTRILPEEEYIKEICKKTEEELTEYLEAKTKPDKLEDPSNLPELINTPAKHKCTALKEINKTHKKKAKERGTFQNRTFQIKLALISPFHIPSKPLPSNKSLRKNTTKQKQLQTP